MIEIVKVLLELNDKTGSGQSTAEIKKLTFLFNVMTELCQVNHDFQYPVFTVFLGGSC